MTEIEALIRSMNREGKSPRTIATELYDRGMKNAAGKFLTPHMVEGFLRHGSESTKPPAVLPTSGVLVRTEIIPDVAPAPRAPGFKREWPSGINYGGDKKLGLNDNSYPLYDVPPYNYTHQGQYVCNISGGISSAAIAVMGGA